VLADHHRQADGRRRDQRLGTEGNSQFRFRFRLGPAVDFDGLGAGRATAERPCLHGETPGGTERERAAQRGVGRKAQLTPDDVLQGAVLALLGDTAEPVEVGRAVGADGEDVGVVQSGTAVEDAYQLVAGDFLLGAVDEELIDGARHHRLAATVNAFALDAELGAALALPGRREAAAARRGLSLARAAEHRPKRLELVVIRGGGAGHSQQTDHHDRQQVR